MIATDRGDGEPILSIDLLPLLAYTIGAVQELADRVVRLEQAHA